LEGKISTEPVQKFRFKGELAEDKQGDDLTESVDYKWTNPLKTPPNNFANNDPEEKG